jgi:hypothetical protein
MRAAVLGGGELWQRLQEENELTSVRKHTPRVTT